MERALRFFAGCLSLCIACCSVCEAQDINKLADEFYAGLADIIERNMDNAESCVREVDAYYQANKDKVAYIRAAAEKATEEISSKMDAYMSMSQKELEALAQQQGARQQEAPTSHMSDSGMRYTNAIKTFTVKYPNEGMKISMKALELVPGFHKETREERVP